MQPRELQASLAAEVLFPLLYAELRDLARVMLTRCSPGQTLQPTALVHEAYLKLAACSSSHWTSPRHFFLTAAKAMRQILTDGHRRKRTDRRGGRLQRVELGHSIARIEPPSSDVLALGEALDVLEARDSRKAQVVSLHCYAGLGLAEIAELFGVSLRTIEREWAFSRAFLLDVMQESTGRKETLVPSAPGE